MAVLKEYQTCSCGSHMFPNAFDEKEKTISYECISCGNTVTKDFSEVEMKDEEQTEYFVLNDAGQVTWKCPSHGYCDLTVDSFFSLYDFRGFEEMQCPLCYADAERFEGYYDEEQGLDYPTSENAKKDIQDILSNLTDEQQKELVGQFEVNLDVFKGDCAEAIRMNFLYYYEDTPFKYYLKELKDRIYDLFKIDLGGDDEDEEFEDGEGYDEEQDYDSGEYSDE